jgi:hypothetical protein
MRTARRPRLPSNSEGDSRTTPHHASRPATFTSDITTNDLRAIVAYLASDELEGRLAGSRGAELASDYIAAQMKRIGLRPVGTNEDYFQNYEFNAGARVLDQRQQAHRNARDGTPVEFAVETDFRPLAFTANAEVEGQVVFVGYGLSVPGKPGEGYDSYAGVNVSNRIALVLRYVPEQVDAKRRAELNRYAGVRYKAMHGARTRRQGRAVRHRPDVAQRRGVAQAVFGQQPRRIGYRPSRRPANNVVRALFAGSGKDLGELQRDPRQ